VVDLVPAWLMYAATYSPLERPSGHSKPQSTETTEVSFKLLKTSEGKSDDGTNWTAFNLITSDGHPVVMQNFPFSSADRADKEFQLFLKASTKVIRRTPEKNEKGQNVGDRVLAMIPRTSTMGPHYTLFWTHGVQFSQISGEHLADVLELEKRLNQEPLSKLLAE
jgi:hypothetical protein